MALQPINQVDLLGEANNNYRAHFPQDIWQISYAGINQANLILETVPGIEAPGITAADKTSWLGQMYFLRALYHLNLVLAYRLYTWCSCRLTG